jgi:hypothetical protein
MRITDPQIRVDKLAYQKEEQISYGGVVDKDEHIEYNFRLENTGNTKLYNMTFDDSYIGVKLDYVNGLTVKPSANQVSVFDKNKGGLDPEDLIAVVTGYKMLEEGETTTEKTYIKTDLGEMVEDPNGRYIYTVNEIRFNPEPEKNITAQDKLKFFLQKKLQKMQGYILYKRGLKTVSN